jgi:hypothetical protein
MLGLILVTAALPASAQEICHITDIDAFLEQCPTNDPAISTILDDFVIKRDGVEVTSFRCTEPISALPIAEYTDELIILQELRTIYYMDRDRCGHLPWTPLSLYDWLRSKVGGFNIDSTATHNWCCGTWSDGTRYITRITADEFNRNHDRTWPSLGGNIGLVMHEARHIDGFGHVSCCSVGPGACDQRYDPPNMPPYGIQHWLERSWIDGSLHTGYTCLSAVRINEIKSSFRAVANSRRNRFCDDPPPILDDTNNPPPPCDTSCAAGTVSCVAPARGVPPAYDPPLWWSTSPPEPAYHNRLDDPRWSGASKITYGDGASEKAELRVLHDTTNLYLSWRALVAPAAEAEQNVLYLGYQRAGGGDIIVKINLTDLTPIDADDSNYAVHAFLRNADGSEGASIVLPPTVTTTLRTWVDSPAADTWAIQLVLPLSELQMSCESFKLWYELLAGTPTAPVSSFTWPRSGADVVTDTSLDPAVDRYPEPSLWQWFRLSSGPTDEDCATAGVSLDRYQIGTTNDPSSSILFKAIPPHPDNTFFARPTNHSGIDIPPGGVQATFRVANWGSVPGDWEEGVAAADLWTTIPGGDNVGNAGTIANGTTANSGNGISFDWPVEDPFLSAFTSGARREHQCVLVELKSNMTPGLSFTSSSVFRNMDFVPASTFERQAELSVKGLAPLSSQPRDLYLYVETINLPAKVRDEPGLDKPLTVAALSRTVNRTLTPAQLQLMAADGAVSAARLDQVLPTYRVHVYHDTGHLLTINGTRRPVLSHQTSFGYYVTHEGEIEGWQHQIDGPGLVELAPNWYKIPVANNGTTTVTTTIEAIEPSRWSLSLHGGVNHPQGWTGGLYDGDLSAGIDLEYLINDTFAVELYLGRELLDGRGPAADLEADHLSLLGKVYILSGSSRPFVAAGFGMYDLDPGSPELGLNAGAGLQLNLMPKLAVEVALSYHKITTPGADLELLSSNAGVRIRF